MARYGVAADLAEVLTALRITGLSAGDAVVQEACLERACGVVDLYLSASPTPVYSALSTAGQQIVHDLTLDIGAYYLAQRLGSVSDRVQAVYDDAIFRLKDIGRGVGSLGSVGDTAAPTPITLASNTRRFTGPTSSSSGTMGGW
jgi:phage gp36-like protein